ncbi:hypothetical protein Tsubulata_019894 [Turnera subulata]|uniref:F-box associated beta-propeller type 3 domain-containing protein n=1 Tax=Turnera subulata TaxID=218843 RepID=A0A9Q0GB95_9ROSI|nr:hypothetical protein Tsubulata_019894 [Turnera subulata]
MLPIKSIQRFRQVSKSWSSFLVSVEFQKLRTKKSTPPETHLQKLLQCAAVNDGHAIESLGCLGDGEEPVPLQFSTGKKFQDIGDRGVCACGFGYDSVADDYKVLIVTKPATVKIFSFLKKKKKKKVEIFSLRTGSWKEVEITSPGSYMEHIRVKHEVGLFLNGALHWEVWTCRKVKIIAFDLAMEKFYDLSVLVLPRDLLVENECNGLGVIGEFLYRGNHVGAGVYVRKEDCNGVSWVRFIEYISVESVSRIYFKCDFIPQVVNEGGYMILQFPGGVQHVLKWDNLDEEIDETGGVFFNIKFSEFRKTIVYIEALTSPMLLLR